MSSDSSSVYRILHKAWKSIVLPRSQNEGELPISSSPTSVTRMRSLTLASTQSHDLNQLLPLYANATEIEKHEYLLRDRSNLSKTILILTFPAASLNPNQSILFGAPIVIAFAASFSAMLTRDSHPRFAAVVENIGILFFALGFFAMTGFFITGSLMLKIIMGLAFAWILLAFIIGSRK